MKVDRITVTAEITRDKNTTECEQLTSLHKSGERIIGLVDQFWWMPFIVTNATPWEDKCTFDLLMVSKKIGTRK